MPVKNRIPGRHSSKLFQRFTYLSAEPLQYFSTV